MPTLFPMTQWAVLVSVLVGVMSLGACEEGQPAPAPSTSSSGSGGSELRCFKDEDGDGAIDADDCGGPDTCDRDDRVYPGQQSYFDEETLCGGYDFNADGVEEPQYEAVVCEVQAELCVEVTPGWVSGMAPPCGEEALMGCSLDGEPYAVPGGEDGDLCGQAGSAEQLEVARCR